MNKAEGKLPSITVSEFKQYLPMLLSTDPSIDRRAWLAICIDPRLRVEVIDDKTGEFVHYVPQLHYTPDVLTGKNVAGRIKEWQLMSEVSPLHGKAYARDHITSDLVKGVPPKEDIEQWRFIMREYGYDKTESKHSDTVDIGMLSDGGDDDW